MEPKIAFFAYWNLARKVETDFLPFVGWVCECHNGYAFSGDTQEEAQNRRAWYYGVETQGE